MWKGDIMSLKQQAALKVSETSAASGKATKLGCKVGFPSCPRTRAKDVTTSATGPACESVSPAGQQPTFLLSPWPMCLSASITLMDALTHFPQKAALSQLPLQCRQPNLCRVTPARERQKSRPGVPQPREEGPPGPSIGVHSLGHQGGSRLEKCYLEVQTPQGESPGPKRLQEEA